MKKERPQDLHLRNDPAHNRWLVTQGKHVHDVGFSLHEAIELAIDLCDLDVQIIIHTRTEQLSKAFYRCDGNCDHCVKGRRRGPYKAK